MIRQFDIWIANLNPRSGTEAGKIRPVLVIQTDLLNNQHSSTLICPITTNIHPHSDTLRVHLTKANSGLKVDGNIMIDQIRAIDNRRLIRRVGTISRKYSDKVVENLKIILDIV